jgi:hypothetical protein
MLLRALIHLYEFYGDGFTVECPTGSGRELTLFEVTQELRDRLVAIFVRGEDGRRPVFGGIERFQTDPRWRDNLLFHEYFHGDNGAGLGASHQTGWTGLIALVLQVLGRVTPDVVLARGAKGFVSASQADASPASDSPTTARRRES